MRSGRDRLGRTLPVGRCSRCETWWCQRSHKITGPFDWQSMLDGHNRPRCRECDSVRTPAEWEQLATAGAEWLDKNTGSGRWTSSENPPAEHEAEWTAAGARLSFAADLTRLSGLSLREALEVADSHQNHEAAAAEMNEREDPQGTELRRFIREQESGSADT